MQNRKLEFSIGLLREKMKEFELRNTEMETELDIIKRAENNSYQEKEQLQFKIERTSKTMEELLMELKDKYN